MALVHADINSVNSWRPLQLLVRLSLTSLDWIVSVPFPSIPIFRFIQNISSSLSYMLDIATTLSFRQLNLLNTYIGYSTSNVVLSA